jgi:drug/metabolite transporter (DMT)-like permease
VFSLLLSWIFLRDLERVTGLIVAGTLLTVLGAALIAWRIL